MPSAGPYEVLVKVRSVALNYRDYVVATGKYPFKVKESVVPCSDIAGDVVEVGHGVEDIAAGDQVISSFDLKTLYGPIKDWDHGLGGSLDGVCKNMSCCRPVPSSKSLPAQASPTRSWLLLSAPEPRPGTVSTATCP